MKMWMYECVLLKMRGRIGLDVESECVGESMSHVKDHVIIGPQ